MTRRGNTTQRAEQFLAGYLERSGQTRSELLERRVVSTCGCAESECEGFKVVPMDCLLPWLGDRVMICG